MTTNTYSEEEFKKILKSLFIEKRRVKELQKQLERRSAQKKIHNRVSDIHQTSLADEHAELKKACLEKNREEHTLKQQIDKVKPVLKRLVSELKAAHEKVQILKGRLNAQEQLEDKLRQYEQKIEALESEKQPLSTQSFFEEKNQIFEELDKQKEEIAILESEKRLLEEELCRAKEALILQEEESVRRVEKENQRFEGERGRLIERLAECFSQTRRQTEIIKDLKEEIHRLKCEIEKKDVENQKYEQRFMDLKERMKRGYE